MTQRDWFESIANGTSARAVARELGINEGNFNRRIKEGKLTAELIIAISYHLGADPVDGLAQNGFLHIEEKKEEPSVEEIAERIQALSEKLQQRIADASKIVNINDRRPAKHIRIRQDIPLDAVAYSGPDEDMLRESEE